MFCCSFVKVLENFRLLLLKLHEIILGREHLPAFLQECLRTRDRSWHVSIAKEFCIHGRGKSRKSSDEACAACAL